VKNPQIPGGFTSCLISKSPLETGIFIDFPQFFPYFCHP
jgi:hypothetical protein